ncbi:MAG: ubiquitin-like protein Pup [Nitrospiraceae bacterium]|jgi:ubiquitin-like protein Pup|nr:ubiquitin-like protein Pup [Nitrospiraceae bacterium]|tara:strand:- start:4 stop:201 length:198 start_codon:yes stop_codon:yes gene_type:complete
MEQRQKSYDASKSSDPEQDATQSQTVIETGEKLKQDIDSLIDEIDAVLEENAEEFVKNYIQKGGE